MLGVVEICSGRGKAAAAPRSRLQPVVRVSTFSQQAHTRIRAYNTPYARPAPRIKTERRCSSHTNGLSGWRSASGKHIQRGSLQPLASRAQDARELAPGSQVSPAADTWTFTGPEGHSSTPLAGADPLAPSYAHTLRRTLWILQQVPLDPWFTQ